MLLVNELNEKAIGVLQHQLDHLQTQLAQTENKSASFGRLKDLRSKMEALQQELAVRVWLNDIHQQPA